MMWLGLIKLRLFTIFAIAFSTRPPNEKAEMMIVMMGSLIGVLGIGIVLICDRLVRIAVALEKRP